MENQYGPGDDAPPVAILGRLKRGLRNPNPKNTAVYFGIAVVLFFLIAASLAPKLNKGFGLLTQKKAGQQSLADSEAGTTTLKPLEDGFVSVFDSAAGNVDRGQDLTVDVEGNIYVTGAYATGKDAGTSIFIRKYLPNGEVIWTQAGTQPGPDALGTAVKANSQNIYVAGYVTKEVTKKDIFFAKYSAGGELIWKKEINMPANDDEIANDFAFDSQNNIYLIGTQTKPKSGSDIIVIKLDQAGEVLWTRNFTTAAKEGAKIWPGNDAGTAIAVSKTGEIYAAGSVDYSTEGENQKIWLASLDTGGKPLWEKTLDEGVATSLALDSQNRLILAGNIFAKEQNGDKFANSLLIKFAQDKEIARDIFDTASNNEETTGAITQDASGNILAVGSQIKEGQKQMFIRKYNSELKFQKDKIVNIGSENQTPNALIRTQNGSLFITGTQINGTNSDIFLTSVAPL